MSKLHPLSVDGASLFLLGHIHVVILTFCHLLSGYTLINVGKGNDPNVAPILTHNETDTPQTVHAVSFSSSDLGGPGEFMIADASG